MRLAERVSVADVAPASNVNEPAVTSPGKPETDTTTAPSKPLLGTSVSGTCTDDPRTTLTWVALVDKENAGDGEESAGASGAAPESVVTGASGSVEASASGNVEASASGSVEASAGDEASGVTTSGGGPSSSSAPQATAAAERPRIPTCIVARIISISDSFAVGRREAPPSRSFLRTRHSSRTPRASPFSPARRRATSFCLRNRVREGRDVRGVARSVAGTRLLRSP